jgi:hypothetical protein
MTLDPITCASLGCSAPPYRSAVTIIRLGRARISFSFLQALAGRSHGFVRPQQPADSILLLSSPPRRSARSCWPVLPPPSAVRSVPTGPGSTDWLWPPSSAAEPFGRPRSAVVEDTDRPCGLSTSDAASAGAGQQVALVVADRDARPSCGVAAMKGGAHVYPVRVAEIQTGGVSARPAPVARFPGHRAYRGAGHRAVADVVRSAHGRVNAIPSSAISFLKLTVPICLRGGAGSGPQPR